MANDEHTCNRCNTPIPPGEIAAKTSSFWLCSACWKLWAALRTKVVRKALLEFVGESA
jgi:hypothetical protein